MIENLQDQAQITLAQFTQIHNPTQPTRYIEKSSNFSLQFSLSFSVLVDYF